MAIPFDPDAVSDWASQWGSPKGSGGGKGSGSDGDVGGSLGGEKCCPDGDMCKCMDGQFDKVVDALKKIADKIGGEVKKKCSQADLCIDEIEDELKRRWQEQRKSCDECESMLQQGLGGSIEYMLACAGNDCKETLAECSIGDPSTWGKPCKGCGKEPCCCEGGICVPCPEDEDKKKQYQGWCDPTTLVVSVTKKGAFPPTFGSIPVSLADTELAAIEQAREYCKRRPQQGEKGQKPSVDPHPLSLPFCDISGYTNGSSLATIAGNRTLINILGSSTQLANTVGKLGIDGLNLENIGTIVSSVVQSLIGAPPLFAEILIPQVAEILGCDNAQFKVAAEALASFGYVEKMTGANLSEFLTPYRYAMNSACRQLHLDPDKAIAAFLGNSIDYGTLDTHWAINGYCPESLMYYLKAARAKPVPFELGTMRLRGIINPAQYHESMRELGYLEPAVAENLFATRQQLPTLSDIIRLMVRDADDDAIAQRFQLDTQFEQKYGRQLKEWSEQQGIPEKVAQYAWRAHWNIPSPTQLFEFWRRLRKDPAFGGEAKLWSDIEAALTQQDILPIWHQHYKAINYNPLGRVDIRRMFNIGAVKEDDLVELYNQLGYSDENAEKLKKFAIRLRDEAISASKPIKLWNNLTIDRTEAEKRLKDAGYPEDKIQKALDDAQYRFIVSPWATAFVRGDLSRLSFTNQLQDIGVSPDAAQKIADRLSLKITSSPALKDYAIGTIDRQVAERDLTAAGINQGVAEKMLDDVDKEIDRSYVINCQRGIHRRFILGDLDELQAINELTASGTVQQRANRMVQSWKCEKSSRGKAMPANHLCNWLAKGVISPQNFLDRLERLGYTKDDAGRLLDDCLTAQNVKMLAQAKKDAKEHAAASKRAQAAMEKAARQEQQEAGKLVRANNQRQATKQRREKQLLSAAQKIYAKCGCDLQQAVNFARTQQGRIASEYALNQDESLQVLIVSADEWDGETFAGLESSIDTNAFYVQQAALSPPIEPLSGLVITNGEVHPS